MGNVFTYTENPVALNPTTEHAFGLCDKHSLRYFISWFERKNHSLIRYYSCICLAGLIKTAKNLSQDSWCCG
jgi:hypothetical protein